MNVMNRKAMAKSRTHNASSKVSITHVAPNLSTCAQCVSRSSIDDALSTDGARIPCTTTLHLPSEENKRPIDRHIRMYVCVSECLYNDITFYIRSMIP